MAASVVEILTILKLATYQPEDITLLFTFETEEIVYNLSQAIEQTGATTYKWMPSEKTRGETSHDPKAIITTYEGNHNHDVPTSKSSSNHDNQPRYRPDETDTISLNLEVGISLMDMTTVTARNSIVKIVKG
ncbi:unnamed protein product [Brassica oleracea]|uniref:(rape) hypothetical protein n=1 Tax=Brassica napus TaxID=3708 RepID=A0A816K8W4_BRANA|nr:unnamed protein product [Brassica napus]